jgi:hypothetical protein
VLSVSNSGPAVSGHSTNGYGVVGVSDASVGIRATSTQAAAIVGDSQLGHGASVTTNDGDHTGVFGHNTAARGGTGVAGQADGQQGIGVSGATAGDEGSIAVYGANNLGRGVVGISAETIGVEGRTTQGTGVYGWVATRSDGQPGPGRGVLGASLTGSGVEGTSQSGAGVRGMSTQGEGVHAETSSDQYAAVSAIQLNAQSTGAGIYAEHRGGGPAGYFNGDVMVTGHIEFVGADCAEEFEVVDDDQAAGCRIDPGTVMVIDSDTALRPSSKAYDGRVAGVITGAGGHRAGIILGRSPTSASVRRAVALCGRVSCKVDASGAPIAIGDLLTTSDVPGHAMKAVDNTRSFGAVLGKALRPLASGRSLIPILVALQ